MQIINEIFELAFVILKENDNKTYYHVTFTSRIPNIKKQGLVIGKKRIWNNKAGGKLGLKRIYLFDNTSMAARWAAKMEYQFKKPISIITLQNVPGLIELDSHIESQMSGHPWYHTDTNIPPECITKITPYNIEFGRALVRGEPIEL